MYGRQLSHDIASLVRLGYAGAESTATAAGAGDATEVDGTWIVVPPGVQSAFLALSFSAVLQATETLTIAHNFQDATALDGTGVADFGTAVAAVTVATGPAGGGTVTGVYHGPSIDLSGNRGWIRVQWTPDLSASGTDTSTCKAHYVWGGWINGPQTTGAVSP